MKFQIITGHYTDTGNIRLYVRGEDGRRTYFDVAGFEPYAGYRHDAVVPTHPDVVRVDAAPPGIHGEKLKKIVYRAPGCVSRHRNRFRQRWEDDIPFVRRLLIDKGVTSGIEVDNPRKGKMIHHEDLRAVDFSLPPLVCGWDIEVYSDSRHPDPEHPEQKVTSLTLWDNQSKHFNSILLDDETRKSQPHDNWTIYHLDDEAKVLQMGVKCLEYLQPDVLVEWGWLDKEYFPPRANLHGIDTSTFRTLCSFNLIPAYKKLYKKGSMRLKDVAFDEGIIDELPPEYNFANLWDYDRQQLILKNKLDVEWMMEVNRKKDNLTQKFWDLKNYAGLEDLHLTTFHGMQVEVSLLRRYHGKRMLPSRPSDKETAQRRKLLGAIVKEPPVGLYHNVSVVDFSRYYQNLLIGIIDNIGEQRLMPLRNLAQELQDVRDEYDRRLEEAEIDTPEYKAIKGVRDTVKYVGESVIGYLGGKHSRWYEPQLFEKVIKAGRSGIKFTENICKGMGYDVLYYDTDGLDVQMGTGDDLTDVVGRSWELCAELNEGLYDWAERKGIDQVMKLKVDMVAARALYAGVKKRKAMNVVWEDGDFCDYLMVKGFEYIRRDSSLVTREVQRKVFEHLLRRGMEGLQEYLHQVIEDVKGGKRSLREVALNKGIRKDKFEDYKSEPDFVRGALWANKHLDAQIRPGDQVKMVYVKRTPHYPSTDVVCFLDEDIIPDNFMIDWGRIIDRTIQGKVNDYIQQGGLSWEEVMGMKKLTEVF